MALPPRIRWRDALDLKLRTESQAPVISNYQLAVELLHLITQEEYAGRALIHPRRPIDRRMFYEARNNLIKRGALLIDRGLPSTILRFPGSKRGDAGELMCAIDPFGYIGYLSAMAFHGLTNRLPKILFFITPEASLWRQMATEKMRRDLGALEDSFIQAELPVLRNSKIEKLDTVIIEEVRTKNPGGWRVASEGAIRVTTLARTFLDMLQRPDLSGGIRHVIEVYEEHAKPHLTSIISEFNSGGAKIDRVRAGYILEEYCGIRDSRIDRWVADAARGGSRKLDAQAEYSPNFSEKWCLSINV